VPQTRRYRFKLIAGHPALDFINTVHDWTVPDRHDYLGEFADAIGFGEAAGLLAPADHLRGRRPTPSGELSRLRELRALLQRIFAVRLAGRAPSGPDLRKLNHELAEAARAARLMVATLTSRSPRVLLKREITAKNAGDTLLRLRVVEAAADLLVSDAMLRVKSCPTCGWFFLDVSKNGSRRWCSMDACGAVAKSRRYYRRLKEGADGGRRPPLAPKG
jgi:predicted RNA-binding Zn ribbon-like protein